MKVNIKKLDKLVGEKLLTKRKHPDVDLWIYNYTPRCQFDRIWTPETMMCRGLIVDANGEVKARPFEKFFNYGEYEGELPEGPFETFEKMDGSLGILYWIDDEPYIATRGSFESEQAIKGTELLQGYKEYFGMLNRNMTYLFEVIYPENRIVVDYKDKEELVLLDIIDNETGKHFEHLSAYQAFPSANMYGGVTDIDNLKILETDNAEGFVLRWDNGFRLKVKFDEYCRLHKLLTGISEKRIWEMLRDGEDIEELCEKVPDEFYKWVKEVDTKLIIEYTAIEREAYAIVSKYLLLKKTKKEAAKIVLKHHKKLAPVIFAILNEKNYKQIIWKMLKPTSVPFKQEV